MANARLVQLSGSVFLLYCAAAVLAGIEVARKAVAVDDAQSDQPTPPANPEVNQSLVDIARVVYSVADSGTRNRLKDMFESVDVI